jgi:hypothetical protein
MSHYNETDGYLVAEITRTNYIKKIFRSILFKRMYYISSTDILYSMNDDDYMNGSLGVLLQQGNTLSSFNFEIT